jgi:hypothetical protein
MGIYESHVESVLLMIDNCIQNGVRCQVLQDNSITTVQEGKDLYHTLCDNKVNDVVTMDFLWNNRTTLFSQEMLDYLDTLLLDVRAGIKSEENYLTTVNTIKANLEAPLISRGKTL